MNETGLECFNLEFKTDLISPFTPSVAINNAQLLVLFFSDYRVEIFMDKLNSHFFLIKDVVVLVICK